MLICKIDGKLASNLPSTKTGNWGIARAWLGQTVTKPPSTSGCSGHLNFSKLDNASIILSFSYSELIPRKDDAGKIRKGRLYSWPCAHLPRCLSEFMVLVSCELMYIYWRVNTESQRELFFAWCSCCPGLVLDKSARLPGLHVWTVKVHKHRPRR